MKAISVFFLILGLVPLTVRAGWSSPMVLNNADSKHLKICLDASGNALALWERLDGKEITIQAAKLPKGGRWTQPTTLSSYAGSDQSSAYPVLAVSPSGHAVAVWQEWTGSLFILKSSVSEGGAWSQPVSISEPSQSDYSQLVQMDQSGNATAIWKKNNISSVIQSAALPFRGTWSTPATLSDPKLKAIEPELAINSTGNVIAIWETESPRYMIDSLRRLLNGNWSQLLNVVNGSNRVALPKIALDSRGNAAAVWVEFINGSGIVINGAILPAQGVWSKPFSITPPVDSVSIDFPFKMDAKGNGLLVWSSSVNSASYIQAAVYHNEGQWSKPVVISSVPNNVSDERVALAVSANGSAVATWTWNLEDAIHASTLLPDGSWSAPVTFSGKNPELHDVAMDPRGYAIMCWTEGWAPNNVTLYSIWTPSTE